MTNDKLLRAMLMADTANEVTRLLEEFETDQDEHVSWLPFGGRHNNRGTIEVSADPGRSMIERVTNAIDAVLETEHDLHSGFPSCSTPRQAAATWLGVPTTGMSGMSPAERRALAQRVSIRVLAGEGRESRVIEVVDRGVGLSPDEMPKTILSLNESNKLQKHYLCGTYGQGGSSTLAVSEYTFIASRRTADGPVGFTLARYEDLPPEEYKTGHYVYLAINGSVLQSTAGVGEFHPGTIVRHFGYDLSKYTSPLGPTSVYGLLNQMLFDPILPVWLDDRVQGYRRVIKGSRNSLNGAIDDAEDIRRGRMLAHHVPSFYISLGDFGRIGVEYWVMEKPSVETKIPSKAFVNPSKPIILTHHGQNHAELSQALIRRDAAFGYLTNRVICQVDCDHLSRLAQRQLFVSNREEAREGSVYRLIREELVRILKSDDELSRLNVQAREESRHEQDETAIREVRKEVARILRVQGMVPSEPVGGAISQGGVSDKPAHPRAPRKPPKPLDLNDPPTYIRILWEGNRPIEVYPGQRRYLRIETDANSSYHDAHNPERSKINVIITGEAFIFRGSTPLQGGRMRVICEGSSGANVGDVGSLRVELTRPGLITLHDERTLSIVDTPKVLPDEKRISMPDFEVLAVDGPEDPMWSTLGWPDRPEEVASSAQAENGKLVIYYSKAFPQYVNVLQKFERSDCAKARSFSERYKIWVAVHSLLLHQHQQESLTKLADEDDEHAELREREERRRMAVMAALVSAREVQQPLRLESES